MSFPFHTIGHLKGEARVKHMIPISDTRHDAAWATANPEVYAQAVALGSVDPTVARLAGEEPARGTPPAVQDAISALVNLGYGRPQAAVAVAAAMKALGDDAASQALIRRGLKELSSG